MLRFLVVVLVTLVALSEGTTFARLNRKQRSLFGTSKSNADPAFLTPLIKEGKLDEAKQLSKVGALPGTSVTSYTGFLTVNATYNSNMFFWFFPHQNESATVLLWLQGGPGGTSLYGLFNENGPFYVNEDLQLVTREFAWTNDFSVLYIDNPVGTGFSFTDHDEGYARNEDDVAENLYEFLQQFYTLFAEQRPNPFYVTGESYAGKYVPAISYKIHIENPKAENPINFKGMAIGDGLCDPYSQSGYGEYLYNVGLIDEITKVDFEIEEARGRGYIELGDYMEAFNVFDRIVNGDITPYPTLYNNATGLTNYFNYVNTQTPDLVTADYSKFLNLPEVRDAIHVGNLTFSDGSIVEKHLLLDIMKSVKPWVQELMENYRVMLYNGQLDVIVAAPLTYSFVNSIEWSGAEEYRNTPRKIWKVKPTDTEVAGYVKQSGQFYMAVVRDSGHMVPFDQPRAASDLIYRFAYDDFDFE